MKPTIYDPPQLGVHELPGDDEHFSGGYRDVSATDAEADETQQHFYELGRTDYDKGQSRAAGKIAYHGDALAHWQRGWDDAEEAAADKTEAELILPVVGVGQ